MSLRESLNQLLEAEDRLNIVELENKALRFQVDRQVQLITGLNEELRLLRRFKQLIERAAVLVDGMKKEIPSLKNVG